MIAAAYEYDAFGNTLRESGPYAASNPFRFATKYTDIETGLVQYNTRYYSPSLGRFINRDTIGEAGGLNLYAYVSNRVPNSFDMLGMWEVEQHEDGTFTVKQNFNTDAGDNWQSYTFNTQAEVDAFLFGNSGSVGHEDFESLPGSTPRGMWSADAFLEQRGAVNDMLVQTRGQSDWLNPNSLLGRTAARDAEARAFERLVEQAANSPEHGGFDPDVESGNTKTILCRYPREWDGYGPQVR